MGSNNSLRYFGLLQTKQPSTNGIWAFTSGDLDDTGWASDKAANLEDLIKRVRDGVSVHKRMLLAIPKNGAKTEDFNDFLANKNPSVLRIRVFDPHLKAFQISFILHSATVSGPPVPDGGDGNAAFLVYKLKVASADFEAA